MKASATFGKEESVRLAKQAAHNTRSFEADKHRQTQEPRYNSGTWGTRPALHLRRKKASASQAGRHTIRDYSRQTNINARTQVQQRYLGHPASRPLRSGEKVRVGSV
jgi:phosphate starvation-inducible protein PhoH